MDAGGAWRVCLSAVVAAWCVAAAAAQSSPRCGDVISLSGDGLAAFRGYTAERLGLFACGTSRCAPIPLQIDERDSDGRWLLDRGPEAATPSGIVDDNDVLLFMAADAAESARRGQLPRGERGVEIAVRDPLRDTTRWVYLIAF